MSKLYRALFALHLFVGVGALFGGMAAILNPMSPLGAPVEALKNSPFKDYLIPGIILFAIIGLGNIFGAMAILFKLRYQGYISNIFCGAIVIWIVVQCIMLRGIHFLHVLFFAIGIVGMLLATKVMFKEELFPTKLILEYFNKENKAI